jgi:hypothetical protein
LITQGRFSQLVYSAISVLPTAKVLVHHDREGHDDDVRDALSEIERGDPPPRRAA